jgi:hypothetical protein
MGKILDYNNFNAAPLENDRFFFCDYTADNANPVTKQLLVSDLNRKRYVKAADTDGLKLLDKDNVYGVKIYDGGNIGVGPGAATTPTSYLDVRGASDASLTLAQFLNPLALTDGRTTQILVGTDRANYKSLALRYTYDTTNDDGLITLRHFEDATEGIHIKGDGNVGINTLTPEYKLDVYSGDIRVRDGSYGVVLDASQAAIKGIAWSAPNWVDGALQIQPDAGGDVYIMYDSGVPAFKVESSNKHVAVGPITDAIADAKLHVLEATSGTLPALKLQNSVASSRAIIELSANSSEVKRYIMSDTSGVVGIRNTNAALGSGSVNFSEGRLNVNATTFGRRFRVDGSTAAADIFIGSFNSSNTTGTKIELRNSSTVAAARPTNLIWFGNMSGTAGAEKVNWMAGAFRNTSVDFFGIHYDSSDFSADNVAFNTTLSSNKFYIDTDGGTHAHGYFNVNTDVTSPFHAAGDYCRGRFLQTFSVGIEANLTSPVFPALNTVLPGVAALYAGYVDTTARTPDAQYMSRAPHNGKLVQVDMPIFFPSSQVGPGSTITPTFYFYSGSSLPSLDGDSGMGSTNSAWKQLSIMSEDTSYTVGFNTSTFTDTATVLEFSAGDYLAISFDTDATTGWFYSNVTLTFEFEID